VFFWLQRDEPFSVWSGYFAAPPGSVLRPGHFSPAGTGAPQIAELNVSGDGRGCGIRGEFTLEELTMDGDAIGSFGASFEFSCPPASEKVRGTLRWRAGNTSPKAPWMVRSASPVPLPTAPPSSSGPGSATVPAPPAAPEPRPPLLVPTDLAGETQIHRSPRPAVSVAFGRSGARVGQAGTVAARLRCPGGQSERCEGRVDLVRAGRRQLIGAPRFSLAPGATRTVTLRLRPFARRALRRGGRLAFTVRVRGSVVGLSRTVHLRTTATRQATSASG
jgi:hypothetical protein